MNYFRDKSEADAYLNEIYSRAGENSNLYLSDYERIIRKRYSGVKKFKRRSVGFCRESAIKSVDDLVVILADLKMVESVGAAREELPKFLEAHVICGWSPTYEKGHLIFKEIKSPRGELAYHISVSMENLIY